MCDYSLMQVDSRPAKVGDKLETTNFHNSVSRGFCGVGDNSVAVCVLPGTEIGFEADIAVEGKTLPCRVAKFRQVNMDNPYTHHDALELPDESVVLLDASRARAEGDHPAAPGRTTHCE